MKKLVFIMLVAGLMLSLGLAAYGATLPVADSDEDIAQFDLQVGTGTVWVQATKNTQVTGFTQPQQIAGNASWTSVHTVNVNSTVNYGLAAGIDSTTYNYIRIGAGTSPKPDDFHQQIDAKAGTVNLSKNGITPVVGYDAGWVKVNSGGDMIGSRTAASTLWTGTETNGWAGDNVDIDFRVRLGNLTWPSGFYTCDIDYLVYEM